MTKTKRPTGRQMDLLQALKNGPLGLTPLWGLLYPKKLAPSAGQGSGFNNLMSACRLNGWVKRVDENGNEPQPFMDFKYALTESGQHFAGL